MATKPKAGAQPDADGQGGDGAAQLVRMTRDPGANPEPHEADVHPDEVANFAAGGWVQEDKA